jgi:hypothetical protein
MSRNNSVPTRGTHYVFNILIGFSGQQTSTHDRHMTLSEGCQLFLASIYMGTVWKFTLDVTASG